MSPIARQLQAFEFVELFNQLGWDRLSVGIEKEVSGYVYNLQPVAQKRGIQILHCPPDPVGVWHLVWRNGKSKGCERRY